MHYKIGTRGSKLALAQSEYVRKRLEESFPEDTFELVIISTTGDKITDRPLAAIGSKGLFVREIEEELLSREINMAYLTGEPRIDVREIDLSQLITSSSSNIVAAFATF